MAKYRAILLFPQGANEGHYEFDAPESFMQNSSSRIVDAFLRTVEGLDLPGTHIDKEINSAQNFRDTQTVTAAGSFVMRTGSTVPFVSVISPARA